MIATLLKFVCPTGSFLGLLTPLFKQNLMQRDFMSEAPSSTAQRTAWREPSKRTVDDDDPQGTTDNISGLLPGFKQLHFLNSVEVYYIEELDSFPICRSFLTRHIQASWLFMHAKKELEGRNEAEKSDKATCACYSTKKGKSEETLHANCCFPKTRKKRFHAEFFLFHERLFLLSYLVFCYLSSPQNKYLNN